MQLIGEIVGACEDLDCFVGQGSCFPKTLAVFQHKMHAEKFETLAEPDQRTLG